MQLLIWDFWTWKLIQTGCCCFSCHPCCQCQPLHFLPISGRGNPSSALASPKPAHSTSYPQARSVWLAAGCHSCDQMKPYLKPCLSLV